MDACRGSGEFAAIKHTFLSGVTSLGHWPWTTGLPLDCFRQSRLDSRLTSTTNGFSHEVQCAADPRKTAAFDLNLETPKPPWNPQPQILGVKTHGNPGSLLGFSIWMLIFGVKGDQGFLIRFLH